MANLDRRQFSQMVAAGVGGAMLAPVLANLAKGAGAAAPGKRPNVLLLGADDLRGQILGCFGDPVAKTPNIDRLAARGVAFDRAYCQRAICNPSRSSMLTGLRPETLRVWDNDAHFRDHTPDAITLPQWFGRHGDGTRAIGKVFHMGQTDPASWSVPALYDQGGENGRRANVPEGTAPAEPTLIASDVIRDVPDEAYLDGLIANEAIKTLREIKNRDEPFFLAVGFLKPHRPFDAPKKYWDLYRPEDVPPPRPSGPPEGAPPIALTSGYRDYAAAVKQTPAAVAELRRGYYAVTSYMDAQVGRVLDEFDRLNLAENTVIVFWADHGYQGGEHAMWGKTSCYELDARVPLIIVPPGGAKRGTHSSSIVENLDIFPTLVELAGLPALAGLEGESLVPLITNRGSRRKKCAYTQNPRPSVERALVKGTDAKPVEAMGYSVRTPSWRYTEWRAWTTGAVVARELYDEHSDPDESRNRASDPECAAALQECEQLLAEQIRPGRPWA